MLRPNTSDATAARRVDNPPPGLREAEELPRKRRCRVGRSARLTLVLLLVVPALAAAQDVTEPALKAAYIFNFALFTKWPAEATVAAQPLAICVLGDAAVSAELERSVKGRLIGERSVAVTRVTAISLQHLCNVLYVSGVTAFQAAQLVAGLRALPVLTISDVDGFIEAGGIAHFYFDQGKLRFSVQVDSAQRARLTISSRLLALANRK